MASREKVTFKIDLDESQFINGLKKVQGALEAVAQQSKKGKITHAEASAVLEGLASNLGNLSKASATVTQTMKKSETNVKSLSQNFQQLKKDAISAIPQQLINNLKSGLSNALQRTVRGTNELRRSFSLMRNVMSQGIDSVRQITQGFLSMGRALTFFVAIPFTAWLKESIQSATQFESAMARVTKVAGFDEDEFGVPDIGGAQSQELNQFIRDISEVAGSSQEEFAGWAETLAQFGVDSVEALKDYLPMMEMMASGTDVASSEVAKRLGNVANAFGFTMSNMDGQARNFVWRMINVINDLENNVGASANQILTAVEAAGPTLSQLGVPGHVVASWSALGIEAGLSADEVGTGLRNLGSFMSRNFVKAFDDGQSALKGLFGTSEEMHRQMRTDFSKTFTDILTHYSNEEDQIKVIAELYDFLGNRAGKLAAALIQAASSGSDGAQRLMTIMERSADQFKNPISLANEYAAVQKTLAYQTQQLKNTFTNLSLAVGDSLIPELKKLVQAAIPVVKTMASLFAGLDDGTKRLIFFGSALVAISGPILFFVSQMAFGASLIMSGLIKLGGVLGTITRVFGVFGLQLLKLNPVAWLFAGTVSRAFGMVRDASVSTVDTVSNIFSGLAKMMPRWGRGIFDGLADGIEGSASRIAKAVNMIAQIISSFFEAHSPPEAGPLQHIDRWGKTLFDTYLQGFAKADFGILKDVAGYVSHILSSWIDIGKLDDDGNMEAMLLKFREDFAGLISQFNKFGQVTDDAISNLTDRLGEASDEIFKLIKLNFQLKSILEDIEGVEERKKEVTQAYRDQVRDLMKSNMSLEEQAQLLGQLQQERDKDLAILDEEQERLEARKDAAQEELDLQKQMLEAYKDQDDIFSALLKALEKMEDALSGAGGGGLGDVDLGELDAEFELEGMADAQEAMASFSEAMASLNGQALKLELTLRTVFGTIGRSLKDEAVDNMGKVILETEDMDKRLQGFAETALKSLSALATDTDDYADVVQDLADIFGKDFLVKFFEGAETAGTELDETGVKTQVLIDALKAVDGEDLSGLTEALSNAEGGADDAFTSMTGLGEQVGVIFDEVMDKVEPAYKKVRAFFLALGGQEVPIETRTTVSGEEIEGMDELINFGKEMGETWKVLETRLGNILGLVGQIGDNILSGLGIEVVPDDISGNVDAILGAVQNFLEGIASLDHPIRWAIGIWLALEFTKAVLSSVAGTIAPWIFKGLSSLITKGAVGAITSPYLIPVTIGLWVIFRATGVFVQGLKDLLAEGASEIDIAKFISKNFSRSGTSGVDLGGTGGAWSYMLLENVAEAQEVADGNPVSVPVKLDESSGSQVTREFQQLVQSLGAGIGPKKDPFGINTAVESLFGELTPSVSQAGEDAGSSYLDGVKTALSQPIELKSIQDVENWSEILGITPEQLLGGELGDTPKAIQIPAPTLSFTEDIDDEVKGLVTTIVDKFNAFFSEGDFKVSAEEGATVAEGIVNGILLALGTTDVDVINASVMSTLASSLAGALFNSYATDGEPKTIIASIGSEWATIIDEALTTDLFSTAGDTLGNFVTIIQDLKTASSGLEVGFSTAAEAIETIVGLVADGSIWKSFVADVATLGGETVGSFGFAFAQGYTEATNLQTFLEGEFLDALSKIVSLFNSLMSGNWSIKVSVIYEALASGFQTGGSMFANQMGIVGETGREFFAPPIRGHVTSHSELSSILSQGNNDGGAKKEINMHVTGSPVQMTEEQLMGMLRRLEFLYG